MKLGKINPALPIDEIDDRLKSISIDINKSIDIDNR